MGIDIIDHTQPYANTNKHMNLHKQEGNVRHVGDLVHDVPIVCHYRTTTTQPEQRMGSTMSIRLLNRGLEEEPTPIAGLEEVSLSN